MKKPPKKHIHVFVGYDDRESMEYKVCKESILDNASKPVTVYPLKHRTLRDLGLFKRSWVTQPNGITEDLDDKRPFSTQFSHSRFLVPSYARYLGIRVSDVVIFVDGDFVFLSDIYGLIPEIEKDSEKALYVVKHEYDPNNTTKMDGQTQSKYPKKLWSSFMVFNLVHNLCGPSVPDVNEKDGSWLHSFSWLKNDSQIGSLNEGWNFIPNHSEKRIKDAAIKAIHYTEGSPLMRPGCKYSSVFEHYKRQVMEKELQG